MITIKPAHNNTIATIATQQSAITMAALPALHDELDCWVFPYSRKYKGYIVDVMSFVEFLAANSNSNSGYGLQQAQTVNVQQIFAHIQHKLDRIEEKQEANKAWMEQQFNRLVLNQQLYGGTMQPDYAEQRRSHGQATTVWTNAKARAMDNPPAYAAMTAMNPGQETGEVLWNHEQDSAARSVGSAVPHPVGFIDPQAQLMDRPNNLHDLWTEYMFGHGGNKPAKSFTVAERNNRSNGIKQKYYNRSRVWRLQVYMLNAGMTAENANSLIMNTYGGQCMVSRIIKAIIRDANNPNSQFIPAVGFSIHPHLVVGKFNSTVR